jgi:hypothetical protein
MSHTKTAMHMPETQRSLEDITTEQITEARAWIADCYWGDLDDASELSDAEVVQGVKNHYDGGWTQFLADALI